MSLHVHAYHGAGGPRAHGRPFIEDGGDPTGTATLRRRFMRASDQRWRAACRLVTEAVGHGDILGLGQPNLNAIALRARHGGMAGADPVTGFRHWLDNLLRDVVVGHDGSWMAPFVSSAEELAAKRARDIGVSVPPPSMSMTLPHRALVLSELHALATLGVQRGTRAAASALASRQRPQAAARRIAAALREAMARSRLMADFAVAKTHAAVLLEHFRAAGITHVGVDSSACKPKRYGVKTRRGVKLRMRDRDPPWFKPDIGKKNQALLIGELRKALPDLPAQARKLGSDLILASTGSRGISIRQAGLVGKLIRQAGGEVPELEPIGKAEEAEPAAGAPDLSELIGKAEKGKAKLEELDVVNVLTAGDDDVCPTCEEISEEGPYDINEAQELIPAHPNCRCTFVPADDARFSQTEFGGGEIPEEEEEPVEPGVAAETLLSQFGAGARKAEEVGLGAVQAAFEEPEEAEALVPEVEAPELPAGVAAAAELGEPEEGEEEGLGAGGVVAAVLGLGAAAAGAAGLLGGKRRREESEEEPGEAPMPEIKEPIDYPEEFAGHTAAEYVAYVNRWLDWALENGWTEDMVGERWDDEEALRDKVGMTPEQEEALLQRVDEVASLVEK